MDCKAIVKCATCELVGRLVFRRYMIVVWHRCGYVNATIATRFGLRGGVLFVNVLFRLWYCR
jgi:hypothetical protein